MLLFSPLGNAHIKTGIVYKNKNIGVELGDIFLTEIDIAQDSAQVRNHFPEAHKSEVSVMLYLCTCHLLHLVAPPKAEFGFWVFF